MPERIQRQRTKGWRMPEGAVYVGRPTKWGNPFRPVHCDRRLHHDGLHEFASPHWHLLADDVEVLDARWRTEVEALHFAVRAFRLRTILHPSLDFAELAGKDLVCWCPLEDEHGNRVPCHADVLLELANGGTHA